MSKGENKPKSIIMNKDQALDLAKEAIRLYKKEERQRILKIRFHNTGILMDNYLELKEYCEKIKYKAADIMDYLDNLDIENFEISDLDQGQDEVIIESIKRSKFKTLLFITIIDAALLRLKADMEKTDEIHKYLVVKYLYMDDRYRYFKFNNKVKELSDEFMCDETTVRRWNKEMLTEISKKLFGVDGLRLDL